MLLSQHYIPTVTPLSNGSYKASFRYFDEKGNMAVPLCESIQTSSRAAITESRVRLEEWLMTQKEMGNDLPAIN